MKLFKSLNSLFKKKIVYILQQRSNYLHKQWGTVVNSVSTKRARVVKQAVQLLLPLLAMSERWRGGGPLQQTGGAARNLMRMICSKGEG